jgi:predicted outer membrane repeat protein
MAIEWGGWENHIRVGIDVSWEAISHGETAATATVKIYTDVDQTWSDTQTLNFGGSISGSTTFSNNQTSGSGAALRAT